MNIMLKIKYFMRKFRRIPERTPPSVLLFIIALLLVLIGLGIPFLRLLSWIGGFILTIYAVVLIVWLLMEIR